MTEKQACDILGISHGASGSEVKTAYMKQVRLHTPEKDPQGFKQVRQAYEALLNRTKSEFRPTFAKSADEEANRLYEQLLEMEANEEYERYLDMSSRAVKTYPREARFQYCLSRAYRFNNAPGKAVKQAEKLLSMDHANYWFIRERALCYLERGYSNKALSEIRRVANGGKRDLDFFLSVLGYTDDGDAISITLFEPFFEAMNHMDPWTEEYAALQYRGLCYLANAYEEGDNDRYFSFFMFSDLPMHHGYGDPGRNLSIMIDTILKHADELYRPIDDYVNLFYRYYEDLESVRESSLKRVLNIFKEKASDDPVIRNQIRTMISTVDPEPEPELDGYSESVRNAVTAAMNIVHMEKEGSRKRLLKELYYADAMLLILDDYIHSIKPFREIADNHSYFHVLRDMIHELDQLKYSGYGNIKKAIRAKTDSYMLKLAELEKKTRTGSTYFQMYPELREKVMESMQGQKKKR